MKSKATYGLIAINVIVFAVLAIQQESLMMSSTADVLAILKAGANLNPMTLGGEYWRVITSMFLHFGVLHLLVNMYGLFSLGQVLEPSIGTPRFILVYFLCGIASGLTSLFFNIFIISAGASGALFGLYGYRLGAEVIGSYRDREKLIPVIINFVIFIVVNALITAQVNVDLSGHIGGCVMGILLSVCHFRLRWLIDNKTLLAVLVVFSTMIFFLPRNQLNYYLNFQRILQSEETINKWFRNTTTDEALKDSLVTIVPVWDSIYSSLQQIHVPDVLKPDTSILKRYVKLRRSEAGYRIKMVQRESYIYLDSLEINQSRFDSLPRLNYVLNYKMQDENKMPEKPRTGPAYDPVKIFYDSTWREVNDPSTAVYFRIGAKDSIGRWQGRIADYFRNGDIQMKGTYKNNLRNGIFIYYSSRGTYESAGRYSNERAAGKWERFHWNGKMSEETYYNDGGFTRNTWDSLGRPQVVNGTGRSIRWYENGKVREEGDFINGRREGYWRGYHADGTPYYEDMYRENRLIRGVAITKEGRRFVYDELSEFPMPEGGMTAFRKYVIWNVRKKDSWRVGSVKVIFNVGVDGSTWDYVILESLCPECDEEAIRLVKEGPRWNPGVLHGHVKIQGQGYVEIPF